MKKSYMIPTFIFILVITLPLVGAADDNKKEPSNANQEVANMEIGLDVLLNENLDDLDGKNVGLITNPTGIDQDLNSAIDLLHENEKVNLVTLYGPEHGVRGDAQAGEGVDHYTDERTGLPVYSLYGDTRKPTPEMLEGVDVLLFDIQDVGARFYTYIYTMAYAMEAAEENDIEFMVLDRPNPISGGNVQGPVLDTDYTSFVGMYPIPQQHGMTVGELAELFNEEFDIHADLEVMKMQGWDRTLYYDDTSIPWVMPSPNMPTLDTAIVYPGTALIEGTNLSEGRGTTKPFELIGAPFIDGEELAENLSDLELSGVDFRAAYFTPESSKHEGELSGGVEVYVTDQDSYRSVETGLSIVKTVHDMYPDDFEFQPENEEGISQFDNLVGNGWVREKIEEGESMEDIISEWETDLNEFKELRREYLLYTTDSEDIQETVSDLEENGDIKDDDAVHDLDVHLEAIAQFEKKEEADKVVKHMNNFKKMVDSQKENDQITGSGQEELKQKADSLLTQWE